MLSLDRIDEIDFVCIGKLWTKSSDFAPRSVSFLTSFSVCGFRAVSPSDAMAATLDEVEDMRLDVSRKSFSLGLKELEQRRVACGTVC